MVGNGKEHPNGIGPAELEGSTDLGFLSAALVDGAKEAGQGGGLGGYAIDDAVDNFTALGRIESFEGVGACDPAWQAQTQTIDNEKIAKNRAQANITTATFPD